MNNKLLHLIAVGWLPGWILLGSYLMANDNDFSSKCFIIGFIGLLPMIILAGNKEKNDKIKQKEIIMNKLKDKGFEVSIQCSDLLVDQNNKKWCVIDAKEEFPYVHSFSDLVEFKVVENGVEYKSNNGTMRAVIGGAMFGVVGAALGVSTAKNTTSIESIYIIITTKDFNKSTEKIEISGPVGSVTSSYYESCVKLTEELCGVLTAIKSNI